MNIRPLWFRVWDGTRMHVDYRGAMALWYGLLVAEGDCVLLQATGLKDRQGRDIYEGDIVCEWADKHPTTCGVWYSRPKQYNATFAHTAVVWDPERAQWEVPRDEDGLLAYVDSWEIIGNVFESPELARPFVARGTPE